MFSMLSQGVALYRTAAHLLPALGKRMQWLVAVLLIGVAALAQAQNWPEAHFRGTPNNWAATAMVKNSSTGLWETQQSFSGTNPRFKISRYSNNWNEAYPTTDYLIAGGDGDYHITFNDNTKAVVAAKLPITISANSICYNNTNNHANPYIYFWNPAPAGSVTPLPAWPGKAMTKRGQFYCYDVTAELANGTMPTSLRIIFSSNGSQQTADLTYSSGLGCYESGVWKNLSACGFASSSTSSSAASSSSVSSSSSSVPASSSSSSSSVVVVSSSSQSSTLSVTSTTLCYDNAAGYANPYIYFWNASPSGSITSYPAWPGAAMTQRGSFYCFDFASRLTGAMPTTMGVKFSNNGNPQTGDLQFTAPNACYQGGTWKTLAQCGFSVGTQSSSSSSSSSVVPSSSSSSSSVVSSSSSSVVVSSSSSSSVAISSSSSSSSSVATQKTRIYFHNSLGYTNPSIHFFNILPARAGSTWPGETMRDLGNQWYSFDFDPAIASGSVVFNNRGAPQTANLNFVVPFTCYRNNTWQTPDVCGAPSELVANAGADRTVNKDTRQVLSAAASRGEYVSATWTSPAWAGALTGAQVITPSLAQAGSYTVTLTLTNELNQTSTDTLVLNVVAPTRGLAARPLLAAPLKFPITGNVSGSNYRFEKAYPNLDDQFMAPVQVLADGVNDLIYVVDKPGSVYVFPNDPNVTTGQVRTLLNINNVVRNYHEQGLLSIAFDPNFAANGYFYVYYIHGTDDNERAANGTFGDGILERWTVNNPLNPSGVVANSKVELLRVPQPGPDHKGGMMQFHPEEGYLYLNIGDGAYGHSAITSYPQDPRTNNNAQITSNLLGTMIRIKPLAQAVNGLYYEIPADNPFVNNPAFRGEIWSYGHRNPWRWSFDTETPYTIWQTEVGQAGYEEVNLIQKGKNYGWPVCEGLTNRGDLGGAPTKNCATDFEPPRDGYAHPTGFSIIGGVVYRGNQLPGLNGRFIFGDYVTKRIWSIVDGEAKAIVSEAFPENIASFGTDLSGEDLLVSTYGVEYGGRSTIYRVVDDAAAAVQIPAKLSATGLFADLQNLIPVNGVLEYSVNTQGWFDGAHVRHFIALPNDKNIGFDPTNKWDLPVGTVLVKHMSIATATNPQKPFTTSVLFRQEEGWQAANYHWNTAGTDANLVRETTNVSDGGVVNRERAVMSAADCGSCHVGSGSKDPLGIHTRQLNGNFNYQGQVDNQLTVFNHIGLFTAGINNAGSYGKFAAVDDVSADVGERAKSYLHTNCAHCHSSAFMDMRYDTPLAQMRLVNVASGQNLRLKPFSHAESVIYIYQTTDSNRMPKGTRYTNPAAETLFQQWIDAVDAEQVGISLTSNKTSLPIYTNVTLSVQSLYDNQFTAAVTGNVTWSSSDPSVISVMEASGAQVSLVGIGAGSTTITAQADGYTASVQLIVTATGSSSSSSSSSAAPVTSIQIAPATTQLTSTQQLVAYGVRSDGTEANLYGQVSWRMVSGANVASVNSSGLLTRLANGEAVVEASYQGLTATLTLTSSTPGLALRFNNPNNWNNVYIYLWTVVNGTNQVVQAWPGIQLTGSDGWWSYVVDPQYLNNGSINVIFNNGAGAQTPDLRNISASSSYVNGAWQPWNDGGNGGPLSRLSVIAGTTPNNERDFAEGTVVTVTADEAPYGTHFMGWTGDGLPYIFTDPSVSEVQLVIPGHNLSLQAVFGSGGDDHGVARDLYAAQCASCHGDKGTGGVSNALNGLHDSSAWTLELLADYIDNFMPMGNSSQCTGTQPGDCAYGIASMIMANAWEPPVCTDCPAGEQGLDSRNLRLLTREEYLNSVRDIFAIDFPASVMGPVPVDGRIRNFDTASFLQVDSDRTVGYEMVAADIANRAITQKGFTGLVSGCSNNTCVVERVGKKLFRRPLATAEVNRYVSLFDSTDGGRTLVQALLLSPHFMYRSELGVLDQATGLYRLTNHEIATLLAYTFWVSAPDDTLIDAAANSNFNIATQVERLLADARAERGLRRFAGGWLVNNQYGFAGISSTTLVEAFKEETVRFVIEAIKANKPYGDLLTANYTWVNGELAQHYGISGVTGSNWVQAPYNTSDIRAGAGLLGHGSFLASRTSTINPAPIKRGVYVREVLMCQEFPPPAAADFNVIFEPGDSNRDATARHTSNPACAACHQYIDGVGFGFESFGSNALFRAVETLGNGETRAINATGAIKSLYSPETTLDPNSAAIAYNSITELAGLIAGSGQGEACFSRQFYRYTVGRKETLSDEPIIRSYSSDLRNGGGLRDMLIDLTQADSFVLRR
ncbi:starch-binding protein [Cellvibrio japonicus]|uniref:Carbohydrate binding protein, putative, cbp26A n=1 Tax=Cellvibrio japonicus (strain Ueda107) TaxID=498211 RepID=B3PC55_CELJU|nr:starch-binding protein [Cellvibrio japonicus]ACE85692.1 carbohydrate binding protein, putative, cbp26A [Cellvibrio japonicus Ueda107]QEI13201.1 starch-binding protein [Cellvibrio japonicus]QEI16775.1 starch-binding protein [Cellvibrio japonicus]QEI20353.1 starch-binding protein [Cellvibrio japonicus]